MRTSDRNLGTGARLTNLAPALINWSRWVLTRSHSVSMFSRCSCLVYALSVKSCVRSMITSIVRSSVSFSPRTSVSLRQTIGAPSVPRVVRVVSRPAEIYNRRTNRVFNPLRPPPRNDGWTRIRGRLLGGQWRIYANTKYRTFLDGRPNGSDIDTTTPSSERRPTLVYLKDSNVTTSVRN